MSTTNSHELCRALGRSPRAVEQLIQRGIISTEHKPGRGGRSNARRWTEAEALRLALLLDMMELGLNARDVAPHLTSMHGFHDDVAFLVISVGALGEIIQTSERGADTSSSGDGVSAHMSGRLYSDIVRGRDLADYLKDERRFASAVLNLDARQAAIRNIFKAANGYRSHMSRRREREMPRQ